MRVAAMHVEVLNHAVAEIPPERMRMHICWASTGGPHHRDVPLRDIVDVIVRARPGAFVIAGANPVTSTSGGCGRRSSSRRARRSWPE